ncbi:L-threonylcarbamoyladenylate synthase [Acaryochloris marina]|uniref:Sua5/YciO/YrdC/YwlC family protein n=1 Tax=Acaryochloris marina (strain MBIC 11017) TaxID=329726 RepID=B0C8E4_ACAM1|nr:L-threonylcarbamoyladenylate synthase [Acaryochloris marina]ABW30099.1 Sua5/YciO/YrdC/YwlC family protein [Acaryochloris marina MBIC11017]BDM78951.1 threonylcarbamoyl-AMP synthase [Acaryochloris marina MBIC10699]
MAQIYTVHPQDPQQRTIDAIRADLLNGAVMLYPTDTVYAIGCDINAKAAVQRVRQIKQMSNDKPLTFLCSSLSNIAQYARVSDSAYKIMRKLIPGPYTFLLPATKLVPKLVQNPKRKTTGIRVPDHPVCLSLLDSLATPIISTSAHFSDQESVHGWSKKQEPLTPVELFDHFDKQVDLIIENGQDLSTKVSTILDLCQDQPAVVREGLGWDTLSSEFAWV